MPTPIETNSQHEITTIQPQNVYQTIETITASLDVLNGKSGGHHETLPPLRTDDISDLLRDLGILHFTTEDLRGQLCGLVTLSSPTIDAETLSLQREASAIHRSVKPDDLSRATILPRLRFMQTWKHRWPTLPATIDRAADGFFQRVKTLENILVGIDRHLHPERYPDQSLPQPTTHTNPNKPTVNQQKRRPAWAKRAVFAVPLLAVAAAPAPQEMQSIDAEHPMLQIQLDLQSISQVDIDNLINQAIQIAQQHGINIDRYLLQLGIDPDNPGGGTGNSVVPPEAPELPQQGELTNTCPQIILDQPDQFQLEILRAYNVRQDPDNVNGTLLGTLPQTGSVTVLCRGQGTVNGEPGTWYYINYQNPNGQPLTGWVYQDALSAPNPEQAGRLIDLEASALVGQMAPDINPTATPDFLQEPITSDAGGLWSWVAFVQEDNIEITDEALAILDRTAILSRRGILNTIHNSPVAMARLAELGITNLDQLDFSETWNRGFGDNFEMAWVASFENTDGSRVFVWPTTSAQNEAFRTNPISWTSNADFETFTLPAGFTAIPRFEGNAVVLDIARNSTVFATLNPSESNPTDPFSSLQILDPFPQGLNRAFAQVLDGRYHPDDLDVFFNAPNTSGADEPEQAPAAPQEGSAAYMAIFPPTQPESNPTINSLQIASPDQITLQQLANLGIDPEAYTPILTGPNLAYSDGIPLNQDFMMGVLVEGGQFNSQLLVAGRYQNGSITDRYAVTFWDISHPNGTHYLVAFRISFEYNNYTQIFQIPPGSSILDQLAPSPVYPEYFTFQTPAIDPTPQDGLLSGRDLASILCELDQGTQVLFSVPHQLEQTQDNLYGPGFVAGQNRFKGNLLAGRNLDPSNIYAYFFNNPSVFIAIPGQN